VISDSVKYTYDNMGNINAIYENGELAVRYAYDALGRLIREDNKAMDKTVMFVYNNNGNILKQRVFGFTLKNSTEIEEQTSTDKEYIYNGDKLLSFDGEACVYDAIGNPTTYRGKTLMWEKGRRLLSCGEVNFTYDAQGRRQTKNGIAYTYGADGNIIAQNNGLDFYYDHTGVSAVRYDNAIYFYRKDAQGNIAAILDSAGNVVVRYIYDAWGNHAVVDNSGNAVTNGIGYLNPFRYRGYYYDVETGLYYLKTRYYDPETGRFITIDGISYLDPESINGLNLYAYCANNPVMAVDPNGEFLLWLMLAFSISSFIGWGLSELLGEKTASGIGSVVNGGTAIGTGVSLFAFGPLGWIAGGLLILVGLGTIAFGVNQIVDGTTGVNYIQKWTGMSDDLYNGLYIGLNFASTIGSIAGNIGMQYASTARLNDVMKDPKSIQNYNKFQFKTYARYSREWKLLPSKNGKGMRALSLVNKGNTIRYGYGINNAEHYFGAYYWIVTNGIGKFRFPFKGW